MFNRFWKWKLLYWITWSLKWPHQQRNAFWGPFLFSFILVNYDVHLSRTPLTLFLAYNRRFARAAQACDEVLLYSQLLINVTNFIIYLCHYCIALTITLLYIGSSFASWVPGQLHRWAITPGVQPTLVPSIANSCLSYFLGKVCTSASKVSLGR